MKISTVKLYTLVLDALWWGVGGLEVLCGFQAALTGHWDPVGSAGLLVSSPGGGSFLCAALTPRLSAVPPNGGLGSRSS